MNFAYHGSRTPDESLVFELLFKDTPKLIGVDTECESLEFPNPVGISIATNGDDAFYFPILPEPSIYLPLVIEILRDKSITKVYHNCIFDLEALEQFEVDGDNIADTLIMAHLAGEKDASLNMLALINNFPLPNIGPFREWIWKYPLTDIITKCCTDAKATYKLYPIYQPKINQAYYELEMRLIPILLTMSKHGLKIDQRLRAQIQGELEEELLLYESLAEEMGFNPSSPKQVAFMLAKDKVFLPMTKKRTSLCTDEATLKKVNHPIAQMVLAYRTQKKLHSTYIYPLTGAARCYTHFHMDAITGRISSNKHNMQNIPKGRVRNIFLPDDGVFTDIDFSQIELRTLAYISHDPVMMAMFESGEDFHQATADLMGIERRIAKNANFATIYGATVDTLLETAGITDRRKALELMELWRIAYPTAAKWVTEQQKNGIRNGYITTLFGRRIPLPVELEKADKLARKAVNYPIQGSAAEIVKRAMLICADAGLMDVLLLQVHDELLFNGDVTDKLIKLDLDHIAPFHTPYEVKLLERWE